MHKYTKGVLQHYCFASNCDLCLKPDGFVLSTVCVLVLELPIKRISGLGFTYLARTLPHILHISIRDVRVRCRQGLVQLFGRVNTKEQDQGLMSQCLNTKTGI